MSGDTAEETTSTASNSRLEIASAPRNQAASTGQGRALQRASVSRVTSMPWTRTKSRVSMAAPSATGARRISALAALGRPLRRLLPGSWLLLRLRLLPVRPFRLRGAAGLHALRLAALLAEMRRPWRVADSLLLVAVGELQQRLQRTGSAVHVGARVPLLLQPGGEGVQTELRRVDVRDLFPIQRGR